MIRMLGAIVRNTVLANMVMLLILFAGAAGVVMNVQEVFPEIDIDRIAVTVPYPGADSPEVEEGISRKVEEAMDGMEGVKRYTTVSRENVSLAVAEVQDGASQEEVYKRVRNAIDSINTWPTDAEQAIISEPTLREEVLLVALWGDLDERTLKEHAERVKDELQSIPEISQVDVLGTREYEISIVVSEERLQEYGLSFKDVANAVRANSLNLPAGTIRAKGEEILLRTTGRKYTGKEFASIVLLAGPNGENITLDRVANINDGFTEEPIIPRFNDHPCAIIGIFKTGGEDAIKIADLTYAYVEKQSKLLPDNVHLTVWGDRAALIKARISLLVRNGIIGLVLVFLSLWLFLEFRLSFWVAMGIPISLSGAMFLLWLSGGTINMISLFGLIMVLGIIVDDAIIVGEAIYVHRKSGEPPLRAAVLGVAEVGMPVFAAVSTTIMAFLPLMFVSGIMGKFIFLLPVVVICALTVSLVESLFILPAHLNHLPDLNAPASAGHPWKRRAQQTRLAISHGLEWFVEHMYEPFLALALRWRYVAFGITIAAMMFTMGLVQGDFIRYQMFPKLDGNDIVAEVEFPVGTPPAVTAAAVEETRLALERLMERERANDGGSILRNVYAVTGEMGQGFEKSIGSNKGMVRAEIIDSEKRSVASYYLMDEWEKEIGVIPGALRQGFSELSAGPPGAEIEMWMLGEDMDLMLKAAEEVKEQLREYEGVYQVADDYRPGKSEIQMNIRPEARALGLQLSDLAQQVYAGYYGEEALRIQRGRDDIRVRVRYTEDERRNLERIKNVRIRTPQGQEVPFFTVADVDYGRGLASITRVDGKKRIAVTAEVSTSSNNSADTILADMDANFFPQFYARYPGLFISFEGAKKDSRDAIGSLFVYFPMALIGIFLIIASVFRSYLQPMVIMFTIPFGIVGAIYGHLLLGYILTIFSIFGFVALAGVVVNDAIVLIERVNTNLAAGLPFFQALVKGGARRFRPIMLTTISTVGGLTPLILEKDMQARILVPMAISIASGVFFATILTLVLIPCLLGILNDLRRIAFGIRHGHWPTREEVEPAVTRNLDLLGEAEPEPIAVTAKY